MQLSLEVFPDGSGELTFRDENGRTVRTLKHPDIARICSVEAIELIELARDDNFRGSTKH